MDAEFLAYADESGPHGSSHYLICGYIGSPRQWQLFRQAWVEVLDKYRVREFHAQPFFGRQKSDSKSPYYGWTPSQAERFAADLATAIHQHALHRIGGAVDTIAFNEFSTGERRYLTVGKLTKGKWESSGAPSHPYQLAFPTLLYDAVQCVPANATVRFIFDQNPTEGGRARDTFQEIIARHEHPVWQRLSSITFADRKQEPGLQAADLLVHCWYAYLVNANGMGRERGLVMDILTKKSKDLHIYSKEFMEALLNKQPPCVRQYLRKQTS